MVRIKQSAGRRGAEPVQSVLGSIAAEIETIRVQGKAIGRGVLEL